MNKINSLLALLFSFLLITSCNNDDEKGNKPLEPVNSFKMSLNNKEWTPTIIGNNPCYSKFSCDYSALNRVPFYNINAKKDKSETDPYNYSLSIQIMNVADTGTYVINEKHDASFRSYANLVIKDISGKYKIYQNKENGNSFTIRIEEFCSAKGSSLLGIKGSMIGILYNKENNKDSIIIDNGKFIFRRVNLNSDCHCYQL